MSDFSIDFQDTATAFADKTDAELKEKYRLFKMLNSPMLNSLGTKAAKFALALNLPVEGLIKRTIYEQFCGGETIEECEGTIERLARSNIGAILDYSVEGKSTEADFDRTKDEIIKTIKRAKDDPRIPFSVFKVTGIAPLGTLERMSAKKKLDAKSVAKMPVLDALKTYPRAIALAAGSFVATHATFYVGSVWLISYATTRLGYDRASQVNKMV